MTQEMAWSALLASVCGGRGVTDDDNTAIINFQNNQKYTRLTDMHRWAATTYVQNNINTLYYSVAMVWSVSGRAEHTMGCQV